MTLINVGASVRDRLLAKARAEKLDFNLLLTRYTLERILYRLSISQQRDQFLLKGALLFDLWFDVPHRPTRDADLLGFGSAEIPLLEETFKDICRIDVRDGMVFLPDTVKGAEIRKEANYAGVRITLMGILDSARCPVQIDVGYGDAVVPGPDDVRYPTLLTDMPEPQLRAYPRYTVVAEKLEALASLGMLNSRLKDYFDLWILARQSDFDGPLLTQAVAATFQRRGTDIPEGVPMGLSDEFIEDDQKQKQWQAFLRKNRLVAMPLASIVNDLRGFLLPVLASASGAATLKQRWQAGDGWM